MLGDWTAVCNLLVELTNPRVICPLLTRTVMEPAAITPAAITARSAEEFAAQNWVRYSRMNRLLAYST